MAEESGESGRGERIAASSEQPAVEDEAGGIGCCATSAERSRVGLSSNSGLHDQKSVTALQCNIESGEITLQKLDAEFSQREIFIHALCSISAELDKRKTDFVREIKVINCREKNKDRSEAVERLMSIFEVLKDIERQESDFQFSCQKKVISMQQEIVEVDRCMYNEDKSNVYGFTLDQSISDAHEKLYLAKKDLGSKLREILSLKKQIDNVPSQTELIQYELRFSELDVQIQERLRQTRKHYDTYNALLEIKELMLKEISLLNSINSQFQEAIVSTTGRSTLVDSMDSILKAMQQKLKKVEMGLEIEQKIRDSLKKRHSSAVAAQRQFSSLLNAIQEECAKHEKLWSLTSA